MRLSTPIIWVIRTRLRSAPAGLTFSPSISWGGPCAGPFDPIAFFDEITAAYPYRSLDWTLFEQAIDFVATGGYAMRAYEQFAKLKPLKDKESGKRLWRLSHPKRAQQYRLNIGTIVEEAMIKVRLTSWKGGGGEPKRLGRGGRVLGEVEESFIDGLSPGRQLSLCRTCVAL